MDDDGRGVPDAARRGWGCARWPTAAELGGTCRLEPSPLGGTRVLARLPLPDDVDLDPGADDEAVDR
ncbi:MAG: hypothetical protein R2746_15220 [Acidimicrobiales bacterium]